jgi:hypothetical protein
LGLEPLEFVVLGGEPGQRAGLELAEFEKDGVAVGQALPEFLDLVFEPGDLGVARVGDLACGTCPDETLLEVVFEVGVGAVEGGAGNAVDRAAFYGTRPYARLREEFETRLQARQQAGDLPDRRDAQIARLKDEITTLRQRLADRDNTITGLRDFKNRALAQLAGQHDEINRLRSQNERAAKVRLLPARNSATEPCS